MPIVNPAFQKLMEVMADCLEEVIESYSDMPMLHNKIDEAIYKFEKRVSKQILGLSKKKKTILLEQLIDEFKAYRKYYYDERKYPYKDIDMSFQIEYSKREYDYSEEVWYEYYTSNALELTPEQCKLDIDKGEVLVKKLVHNSFLAAYEQVLEYYAEIAGRESAIMNVIDRYDRYSRLIRLHEANGTIPRDNVLLVDKVMNALKSEEYFKRKEDVNIKSRMSEKKEIISPLKWNGSIVELLDLIAALRENGFISEPIPGEQNEFSLEKICRAICGLFDISGARQKSSGGEDWVTLRQYFKETSLDKMTGKYGYDRLKEERRCFDTIKPSKSRRRKP